MLTGRVNYSGQIAVLEDSLSVLRPRPTQVDLLCESGFGIISCFYGARVDNICMMRTRYVSFRNPRIKMVLHIPSPEDGEPEAVIAPAATDAMTLDLIYVFAVCPNMKSIDTYYS